MTAPVLDRVLSGWEALTGATLTFTPAGAPPPDSPWRMALEHDGEPLGWLSVMRPPDDFTEDQLVGWLGLCAHVLAAALGERNVASGLADEVLVAWNQQAFLNEALKVTAAKPSVEEVAAKVSVLAKGMFDCQNAFLVLQEAERRVWGAARPIPEEVVEGYVALLGAQPVLLANDRGPTFLGARIPLTTPGEAMLGMLGAQTGEFRARDRQLAESLAEQIGTVLDNIALQKQRTATLRLEQELEIAAQIQSSLLPARLPQPPGFDLAGVIVPAHQVGGDFYDVVEVSDGSLAILMGDVAGKGIPAAMLTTLIRAELRGQALAGITPGLAVARANSNLEPDLNRLDTFATALVARLAPYQQQLTLASAGHTATFHWRDATQASAEVLSTTLPLGIFQESLQTEQKLSLAPGDMLVFYSDGVTEALGPDGGIFGWNGLKEVLEAVHTASAEAIVQAVLQATDLHRNNRPLSDDLTLLVVKHDLPTPFQRQRSFVFPVEMGYLKRLEGFVQGALGERTADPALETWLMELNLAAVEHVSNIMRHAYGEGHPGKLYGLVTFREGEGLLTLETVDTGRPFDPARLPPRPTAYVRWQDVPEGGYGLPLIRAVMDEVHYHRQPAGRNHWQLRRRLP